MKTLIAYATKYGSVLNAIKILQEKLEGDIEIVNLGENPSPDITRYDNVIIGGSIYVGKIQKQVRAFCEQHVSRLLTKKVGLFICAAETDEQEREAEIKNNFPPQLLDHATAVEWFGHEVHWEHASFFDRLALRMIKGVKESVSELNEEHIARFAEHMNA